MGRAELEELTRRRKLQAIKLMEVSDLTGQMAQALDRKDQVSLSMLLAMRQEPLLQLQEMDQSLKKRLMELDEDDAIRCSGLLRGEDPETEEEKRLSEQNAQYQRLLERAIEADRRLSLRMGGNRSFYRLFRESE